MIWTQMFLARFGARELCLLVGWWLAMRRCADYGFETPESFIAKCGDLMPRRPMVTR